ncbi:YdaS family helix-turn-helix protein [Paraburkholderia phenazinium]|uniref:YdaS family helix-turn-helix protein n=1 Tax=Paraburkholderia phenazinium TaxID=60549 RepID=UPI000B829A12
MATEHDTESAPPSVAEALDDLGGDSAVARLLKLSPWAISKWRKKLPPGRVLWLSEQTQWKWTPHQLAPRLYPHPSDGLPEHLRDLDASDDVQPPVGGTSSTTKQARAATRAV